MATKYTLEQWEEKIKNEVPYIDVKPYSHNIISIALGAIDKHWGSIETNNIIIKYKLNERGWEITPLQ